ALARKIQKQTCQEPKKASFCTLAPRNRFLLTRLSATKPITSHEAVWPCQGQPCSMPGSYWLVILDIGIEIAKTLDRSDHDRDLGAQLRATAGGNCRVLPMSLRLATISRDRPSMPWDIRHGRTGRSRPGECRGSGSKHRWILPGGGCVWDLLDCSSWRARRVGM